MNQAFQQILKNQMTIMEELGDIKFCVLGLLKGHIQDDYNKELLEKIESTQKLLNQRM
ncbi:MAG: hypothetical protein ACLR6T_04695 [Intestinibacter sp.]